MQRLKSYFFLAGVTLSSFCFTLFAYRTFYNNRKKKLLAMQSAAANAIDKKKVELEITIDHGHLEWITQCTSEFGLPSIDKALRILLTYAQQVADETLIFEQVRCNFCKDKNKFTKKYNVDMAHDKYLDDMVSKHKLASKDKLLDEVLKVPMLMQKLREDVDDAGRKSNA
ncbi:hypothetical protein GOP47_0001528 [Adiantum capillus-veneris]|uniref:Uncharacterized protein n=1 Tax=Adiantum capillus-veneris TaxID=13818 RepID=A0A9D4V976_ADICA|nr:hypothetical protein GOP47_0001528 [Adiantum capillus-veneris]